MAVYAHRAVWMIANHAAIPDTLEINHRDGNPMNNCPSNLELATRQENTLHAGRVLHRLGKKEQRGEKNTSHKLMAEQVVAIRRLAASKSMTQQQIAKLFHVSQQAVTNIHTRKTWRHLP